MTYRSKAPFALLATFVVVFGIHLVGSFVAWSLAPGNVVPQESYGLLQRIAWPIFEFPLFKFLPDNVTTTSFESILVLNSLCVAFVFALIALIAFVHFSKPKLPSSAG